MTQGKVKWFNNSKGYGFLTSDTHDLIFVHYSAITGEGFKSLNENELVSFELLDGPKGPQAMNVMRLTPQSSASPVRHCKKCGYLLDTTALSENFCRDCIVDTGYID